MYSHNQEELTEYTGAGIVNAPFLHCQPSIHNMQEKIHHPSFYFDVPSAVQDTQTYRPQYYLADSNSLSHHHQPTVYSMLPVKNSHKSNLSSRKKKNSSAQEKNSEPLVFDTDFRTILKISPPLTPPALLRNVGRKDACGLGKIKVILRISPEITKIDSSSSILKCDARKKQVTVLDPSSCGFVTPEDRRIGVAAPKMFAFDAIFTQDDSQTEICSGSLVEVIQAVLNGVDSCLFSYGNNKLGKTYTMIGSSESTQTLGIIPCAISWLFKLINEEKQMSGARFSVRISAVEIAGKNEVLKDLLAVYTNDTDNSGTSPGVYLREDPIFGAQLQNLSELRAPTIEKAAFYLDAAVANRSSGYSEDNGNSSHLLFTLHIYQYRIDKSGKGAVAGGRSRLHLLDLSCAEKQGSPLSLSAIANIILCIFNGQKHVPFKDYKLTQVLREILGSVACRASMIAHVSASMQHYPETLATIQFASRIHRLRRKKLRYCNTSSGESSCDERRFKKMAYGDGRRSGSSDPDYTSSSEQSCDTVIYVGPNGLPLSDRELTDNEGPPGRLHLPVKPLSPYSKSNSFIPVSTNYLKKPKINENASSRMTNDYCDISNLGANHGSLFKQNKRDHVTHSMKNKTHSFSVVNGKKNPVEFLSAFHKPESKPCSTLNQCFDTHDKLNSDEHWIDRPRVKKTWMEAQTLLPKQEMWVDGPQVYNCYLDSDKREMIQKWVELQSSEMYLNSHNSDEIWIDGEMEPGIAIQDKTNDNDQLTELHPNFKSEILLYNTQKQFINNCVYSEALEAIGECSECEDENNVQGNCFISKNSPLKDFHLLSNKPVNEVVKSLSDCPFDVDEVSNLANQKSKTVFQTKFNSNIKEKNLHSTDLVTSKDINVDVNLPLDEPVMKDSCLQVNEEDIIALTCEEYEDHPLRVLSEENLASTFSDSFSHITDFDTWSIQTLDDDITNLSGKHSPKISSLVPKSCRFSNGCGSVACVQNNKGNKNLICLNSKCCETSVQVCMCQLNITPSHESEKRHETNQQFETEILDRTFPIEALEFNNRYSNNKELISLRHPDGSSNPSIDKLCEEIQIDTEVCNYSEIHRSPGNGASNSDSEDKVNDESGTSVTSCNGICDIKCENNLNRQPFELDVNLPNKNDNVANDNEDVKLQDNAEKLYSRNLIISKAHLKTTSKFTSRIPVSLKNSTCNSQETHNTYKEMPNCKYSKSFIESKRTEPKLHSKIPINMNRKVCLSKDKTVISNMNDVVHLQKNSELPQMFHDCNFSNTRELVANTALPLKKSVELDDKTNNLNKDLDVNSDCCQQTSGTSSGYESMVRESEESNSSISNVELVSDSSEDEKQQGVSQDKSVSQSDVFEIKVYDEKDVERLEKRRMMEETYTLRKYQQKIRQLRLRQAELRNELSAAKSRLMVESSYWSYDLHVEKSMDMNDPSFLEVLQHETDILAKRVDACKSRIMMVTCFDSVVSTTEKLLT